MEANKTNMIPDEKLETVTGGGATDGLCGHYVLGSDGKYHPAIGRIGDCDFYHCKGCGGSKGNHKTRCRTAESRRDMCMSCYYFEELEVNGCCRRTELDPGINPGI